MMSQGGEELKNIEQIVRQNLSLTREILESVEKTRKYILWLRILSIVKLVVILLPIVLALIYLPPIFTRAFQQYSDIFGQMQSLQQGNIGDMDPNLMKGILNR